MGAGMYKRSASSVTNLDLESVDRVFRRAYLLSNVTLRATHALQFRFRKQSTLHRQRRAKAPTKQHTVKRTKPIEKAIQAIAFTGTMEALASTDADASSGIPDGAHLPSRAKFDLKNLPPHLLNALLLCVPRRERDNLSGVHVLQLAEGEEPAFAREHKGDLEGAAVLLDG